jgi:hypothetical protein
MFNKAKKAVVDCLVKEMLSRPNDFTISQLTMTDNKTKMEYWIGNSFFSSGINRPYKLDFGFVQGYRFHKALADLKAYQAIQKTCEGLV